MANPRSVKVRNDFYRMADEAAGTVASAAGSAVEARAKVLVPVATGALKASIKARMLGDGSVSIGSDLPYSGLVEFGSSRHEPQPYLRPALDSLKTDPPTLTPRR